MDEEAGAESAFGDKASAVTPLGEETSGEPAFEDEGCDPFLSTGDLSPMISIVGIACEFETLRK